MTLGQLKCIMTGSEALLQMGNIAAALRILAFRMGNIGRAIEACERSGNEGSYAILLDLLLQPPDGREPMHEAACQLLAAQGTWLLLLGKLPVPVLGDHQLAAADAQVDPQLIINSLSEEMRLSDSAGVLACLLCDRVQRRRQGAIRRSLKRLVHLNATAERAEVSSWDDCRPHGGNSSV